VSRLVKAGIRRARDSGADARAEALERVRSVGAGAISEAAFTRALQHAGGESGGGVLTATDLRSIDHLDAAAETREQGGARWVVAPWAFTDVSDPVPEELGTGHAVCSVDVRGAFAVLCYRRVRSGISVDELEMDAPPIAVPVLRGITRVAPGMPLPSPAPIAIRVDAAGAPLEAVAAPAAAAPTADALASARLRIRWDASTRRAEVVR
jgi:gamma-glutamyltranspeptidase/glutathione hydrolase